MASNIYYTMLESAASEQSARMSAMENASSNAGSLSLTVVHFFFFFFGFGLLLIIPGPPHTAYPGPLS
jgi:hypothetical protein